MTIYVKQTVLPSELKAKIDAVKFTAIERNKAYKLLEILYNYIQIDKYKASEFIPLAKHLFIKLFNDGRYYKWFKKLIDAKILLTQNNVNGTATYFVGHCIHYKINPALLTLNLVEVEIELKSDPQQIKILDEDWSADFIKQEIFSLSVKEEKLLATAKKVVEDISIENFVLDENIKVDSFEVQNRINDKKYYTTLAKAIEFANANHCNVIQDKNKFIIAKVDSYLLTKQNNTWFRYATAIKKLSMGKVYANRNDTNNRLDHNLTSLAKPILKIIKEENDLVEIDLANSQFAILAYLMENDSDFISTEDFEQFKLHAGSGNLYDYLANVLSVTRKEAKMIMMQVAFSSHKSQSTEKSLFAKHFPTVAKYINEYKSGVKQSCEFSIHLQTIESRMFVDHFYNQLKRNGVWVITKHDSLLVKKDSIDEVMSYLSASAATLNFNCTFRNDNDQEIIDEPKKLSEMKEENEDDKIFSAKIKDEVYISDEEKYIEKYYEDVAVYKHTVRYFAEHYGEDEAEFWYKDELEQIERLRQKSCSQN